MQNSSKIDNLSNTQICLIISKLLGRNFEYFQSLNRYIEVGAIDKNNNLSYDSLPNYLDESFIGYWMSTLNSKNYQITLDNHKKGDIDQWCVVIIQDKNIITSEASTLGKALCLCYIMGEKLCQQNELANEHLKDIQWD